jgi:ataxin-10
MLCTTPIGARVCISLLDRMVTLFDAAEPSDGAKAFDIGYDIQSMTRYTYDGHSTRYNLFARLFDGGLWPDLYSKLSM